MARPRTLDRGRLLDAAEDVVSATSAAALSFGNVAAAAGVPKASVQSAFGTREALIDAMLERWLTKEQERFDAIVGKDATESDRVRAHIRTTGEDTEEAGRRMAGLVAALAGTGEQSASTARWYTSRIGNLQATTAEERRQRAAFLAAEGVFFLRYFIGLSIDEALWSDIFADLQDFIGKD